MDRFDTDDRKEAMLAALEFSLGNVKQACDKMQVARQTHYNWLENDEYYRQRVEEIKEMRLDFAESELMKLIKEGNVAATIFFLKTQGKRRGYVERQEVTGADGAPIIEIIGNI
jgi:hypothetical protein